MFGSTKLRRGTFVVTLASAGIVAGLLPAMAATQLTGAGSTFVYPYFSKAFYTYSQSHADVAVNYQSIGSGGGIQQFTAKTVDFGASDVPMNADEIKRASGTVIQIPVALGGEVITYNLPSVKSVHLTRENVVDIFLGKIARWNDPALKKMNSGVDLPDLPIVVVHRSDGSGTTYIFTDFLSHVSADWKTKVGTGKSVQWPAPSSVGGKGNEGVAGAVRQTPGAIGYVELAYAVENKMQAASMQNSDGKMIDCSQKTVAAAAATKASVSASDFSIVDRKGADSWPISGYTWAMVYADQSDKGRAKLVKDVLEYVVSDQAQQIAGSLNYVPLPNNIQDTAKHALSGMKV